MALLLALAHLVSTAHLSLVEHEVCDDHGRTSHGAALVDAVSSNAGGVDQPAWNPTPAQDGHGEDHCSQLSRWQTELSGQGLVASHVGTHAPPVASAGYTEAQSARYRLAPKQSPPA